MSVCACLLVSSSSHSVTIFIVYSKTLVISAFNVNLVVSLYPTGILFLNLLWSSVYLNNSRYGELEFSF